MKLESTDLRMIQVSIAHSVLFLTRFKGEATIYEAYLIEVQADQAPDMNKEPMNPILLRMSYRAMLDEGRQELDFLIRMNRCIPNETERYGYSKT